MKKIYITAVLAFCAISCQVTSPSSKVVRWSDLRNYSLLKMGECVSMPVEIMETAIDLEAYLLATNEEKMSNKDFYGMVTDYGNGTYGVSRRNSNLSFIVDTKGKSIWEAGAAWEFASISFYNLFTEMDVFVENMIDMPEGTLLVKDPSKDSTWTFTAKDKIESVLTLMPSDSLYYWNVKGSCLETSQKNGTNSVSATESAGMTVRKVWKGSDTIYPTLVNSYSGTFATDIYKGNEIIDFCRANFRPGFTSTFTTSRSE